MTSETFDYTNGEFSITTYNPNGTGTTQYYSGPNGTGSPIPGIASATATSVEVSSAAAGVVSTTAAAAPAEASPDGAVITVTGSDQFIDPGMGDQTIQFISGATADTLVLHLAGSEQVQGFDPAAGAMLDLSSLLGEAQVNIGGDMSQLGNYLSVVKLNGSAEILFDPTGQGGGSQVAMLVNGVNGGGLVAQLQTLKSFEVQQIGQSPLTLDCRQGDLCLEGRAVVTRCTSRHVPLLLRGILAAVRQGIHLSACSLRRVDVLVD